MHLQIIFVIFATLSTLFCIINAAQSESGESSKKRKNGVPFSVEENEFILKEVSAQALAKNKVTSWTTVAKAHARKVFNKEVGFKHERSPNTLRRHFERYLKHHIPAWKPRESSRGFKRYTAQEEELINKELLNESFPGKGLYKNERWQAILEKHNIKRLQKCDGFPYERSLVGLRSHFKLSMRLANRVTPEVMARFPRNFKRPIAGASTSNNAETGTQLDHNAGLSAVGAMAQEISDEEDDVFDTIMRELDDLQTSVDDGGIDHSLFVNKGSSKRI